MRFEVLNTTNLPIRIPVVVRQRTDYCIIQPGKHVIEADTIPNSDKFPGLVINPVTPVANPQVFKASVPTPAPTPHQPSVGRSSFNKSGTTVSPGTSSSPSQPQVVVSATTEKGN